jgi:hypothetical protein
MGRLEPVHLAQDRDKWRALLNMAINISVPEMFDKSN